MRLSVLLLLPTLVFLLQTSRAQEVGAEKSAGAFVLRALEQVPPYGDEAGLPATLVQRIPLRTLPEHFRDDLHENLRAALSEAESWRTDAEGRCSISRPEEPSLFVVWTEQHFGFIEADQHDQQVDLVVQPYELACFEVRDEHGAPVSGVPARLVWLERSSGETRKLDAPGGGVTDEQGVGRIVFPGNARTRTGYVVGICLDVVFAREQVTPMTRSPSGVLRARHVLPPFARMRIRIRPGTKARMPDTTLVVWPLARTAGPIGSRTAHLPGADKMQTDLIVGLNLQVDVQLFGSSVKDAVAWQLEGPTKAGETKPVSLDLPPGSRRILVRGRLVDSRGEGISGRSFEYFESSADDRTLPWHTTSGRTKADGSFEIAIDKVGARRVGSFRYRIRFGPSHARYRSDPFEVVPQGNRIVSVGNVVMSADPIIVAGQIRDEAGRGVGHARVRIRAYRHGESRGEGRFLVMDTLEADDWGHFEYRSALDLEDIEVEFDADFFEKRSLQVRAGDDNVDIALQSLALIRGRVVLEGQDPSFLAHVWGESTTPGFSEVKTTWLREDGSFELYGFPGTCRVRFLLDENSRFELADLGDIELKAGQATELGVLPLKIEGILCRIEIEVDTPDVPVNALARLRTFEPGRHEPRSEMRIPVEGRVIRCLVDSLPADLEVDARGHLMERIRLVDWQAHVRLREAPYVQLVAEGLEDLPENARVWFDLEANDDLETSWRLGEPWPVRCQDAEVWLRARRAGDYAVKVKLGRAGEGETVWWPIEGPEARAFTVKADQRSQSVRIVLDKERVAQTWQQLITSD